ncbi:MAG: tRNA dihydrouridine synthase DusB [Actinobacteria bacterium]|nr:tRNA dihydrouridine synthase DusB [Actinomycetota bacterium]
MTLMLGRHALAVPVVLAPMAGITNEAYRSLCRTFAADALAGSPQVADGQPPGLFVSEMVTARALVERDERTMRMVAFAPDESLRSLQLYGVDPTTLARAAAMVRDENLADHIDLNFGCPVPKVTRKGGGSALPYKRKLFARVVQAVVDNAGELPVTVKMRKGLDDDHLTYLEAGQIAQDAGVAWVALHARTTLQYYSGQADLQAIEKLKAALTIPVLGNGDIWEATDAVRMMEHTGCDGVVVGRGCLGRPWLFADLAMAFSGGKAQPAPQLRAVTVVMLDHLDRLMAIFGEYSGTREMRKHMAWYLKGFSVASATRLGMSQIASRDQMVDLIATMDLDQSFNSSILGSPRGRTRGAKRIALPENWLDDRDDDRVPLGADVLHSGG